MYHLQTTEDLEQVDKQRREAFKEYEMQKQFEKEQKMKGNTGNGRFDIYIIHGLLSCLN